MSGEPITSADAFTEALRDVVIRYMAHLEPSADLGIYAVTMDVAGDRLNVVFRKQPGQGPYIAFTLTSDEEMVNDRTTTASGLFGRRS